MAFSLSGGGRAPLFLRLVTPYFFSRAPRPLRPPASTVFILSTGRTGTKYLADVINQPSRFQTLHEPKPSRILQAWTTAYLLGRADKKALCGVLAQKRWRIMRRITSERFVESNHFAAGFAPILDELFPDSTIVHIVRDPRDFITSMINRGNEKGFKLLVNKYLPFWAITPAGRPSWRMRPLEREAVQWAETNKFLSDYGRKYPRYHFFRFEDVFAKNNRAEMKKLLKACGLSTAEINQIDWQTAYKNPSRINQMPAWRDWSAADKKLVQKICGSLMKTYGYGGEAGWPAEK